MVRTLATSAFLLSAFFAVEARAKQLKVCTFSFHGPEEVRVFVSRLPTADFQFLDLNPPTPLVETGADAGAHGGSDVGFGEGGGLDSVCRSDVTCDVVVLSAEFAGRFFGRSGRSLSLQEMEEASCQTPCDGLFHAPREVFLLACNTLATKDKDLRGPAAYLQVLLEHGFDRASAERVVAMRYGPLGQTFREALRRIFMGVPRIYGFSSVAPTGTYTAPMLERYFRSMGNYRRHLEQVRRDGPRNRKLAAAFAGTTLVETSGLAPSEPAAADRELICTLYDERQTVARRLEIVEGLMDRSDLLAFVPSLQVFVKRHPWEEMDEEERQLFEDIQANTAARERIFDLIDQLDVSALQLELGHFAMRMGWMTSKQFRAMAIDTARQLLRRRLTSEVVDVMCEIPKHQSVGDQFVSADLPERLFRDAEGVRLVSCLAPPGDEVSARLAAALAMRDPELRVWAAHGLTRRLPLPDPVLLTVVAHVRDPAPDVAGRLRWILAAQRPLASPVQRALEAQAPEVAAELPTPTRTRRWFWE
ncbi:MAG: hypothetical protein AB7V27_18260 [Candidatus Binatia bacterium]